MIEHVPVPGAGDAEEKCPPLGGADGAVPRRSLERPVGPGICGCESFLRAVGRTQDATEETGLWLPLCRQRVES